MWACSRNTTNLSVPGSEGDDQAEDPQKDMAGRTGDLTHSDTRFPQAEVPDTSVCHLSAYGSPLCQNGTPVEADPTGC